MSIISDIRYFFEKRGFAVSSRLGEMMGIRTRSIRLFFVYLSFATFGMGSAIYLVLAFWFKLKDLVYSKRSSVFDL